MFTGFTVLLISNKYPVNKTTINESTLWPNSGITRVLKEKSTKQLEKWYRTFKVHQNTDN